MKKLAEHSWILAFLVCLSLLVGGLYAFTYQIGTQQQITGAAIANEGTLTAHAPQQIGTYKIDPTFIVDDSQDILGTYAELQKEIRQFHAEVSACEGDTNRCIQSTLRSYEHWSYEEECEDVEEKAFYDFTQPIYECFESKDADCWCTAKLSEVEEEQGIVIAQNDNDATFALDGIEQTIPIQVLVENEPITTEQFLITSFVTTTIGKIQDIEESSLYLYKKDANTISFESQSTFSTKEYTNNVCGIEPKKVYKFCVNQGDTEGEKVPFEFALDFE